MSEAPHGDLAAALDSGAAEIAPPIARAAPARPRIAPGVLDGPILRTIVRLAAPTVVVLVAQTLVGVAETYFVSFLGTDALAGVAMVFPVLMLMQMMANGGIGGGVASAIARALGAGRAADAAALLAHSLMIATALGAIFTVAAFLAGPAIYRSLGGEGGALAAALTYSNTVFIGAIPLWITAVLSAALRGAGNVKLPALITLTGAVVSVALSPALIFGWGPLPRLGVAGAGAAVALYYVGAAIVLIRHLVSDRATVRLALTPFRRRLFADIMGVGGLSAVSTVQTNLTVAIVTGAVGLYGTEAIAGYGIASRIDYLLIPLLFGLGTAILTMVGTAVGAGAAERARRVAWAGAAIGGGGAGLIGLVVAIAPNLWTGMFTEDPAVLETAARYLRIVGPTYVLTGVGFILYFASQGANRVLWPLLAGTARLAVAGFVGWLVAKYSGAGLGGLFTVVAVSATLFGLICIAAVRAPAWGRARRR